jgi:hypothetical protein
MKYLKCFRWYKGPTGNFFPNNIYLSNYHFTYREKPIIRPYDRWVVLCTVKKTLATDPCDPSANKIHGWGLDKNGTCIIFIAQLTQCIQRSKINHSIHRQRPLSKL